MIEKELPTVDTAEGYKDLERDIRRDTRRRRALVGAAAVAALLVAATTAVLLDRDGEDHVQPAPGPDRPQRMLIHEQDGRIAYINADGSRQTLAVKDVDRLAASPGGQQIAYITTNERRTALWIADADGTHRHRIPDPCGRCQPGYGVTWSHDGTRLAYSEFTPGRKAAQLRIRTIGTGREQVLTMPAGVDPRGPVFSPDDQNVALNASGETGEYVATVDLSEGVSSWTRLSDTYNQVQLPSWSADGRTVYFTATTRGADTNDVSASIDLFAVGADGTTSARQVTHAARGERYLAASPYRNRFLVSRAEGNARWEIGWLSGDGTTFTPITDQEGKPILGEWPQPVS